MNAKVLFFDDIFSDLFRKQLTPADLAWDDGWVSAVVGSLQGAEASLGLGFEVVKSGDLFNWKRRIEEERPDALLLDLFWPEEARAKGLPPHRVLDLSLDVLRQVRKAFPDLPVVCYTVRPERDAVEAAYAAGATFVLEKVTMATAEVQAPLKYVLLHLLRKAGKAGG